MAVWWHESITLQSASAIVLTSIAIYIAKHIRIFLSKARTYRKYCISHTSFAVEAGQGKYKWLEDPFSWSRNYWLCRHEAIKHVFSRQSINETDHRAGFDWFHYAGWEIPTMDPKYKHVVRDADQTVHNKLAKSKLTTLLSTVEKIARSEIDRIKTAVGVDGQVVSLHSLMYRLAYKVNCTGIFGPDMNAAKTRIILQTFTEKMSVMFNSFNWPLPVWLSLRIVPGARQTAKARQALYEELMRWYQDGGVVKASDELKAIVDVFERNGSPVDVSSKFLNMMMLAFLTNTPESLAWLFDHLVQAPELLQKIRSEVDALESTESLVNTNFRAATPHLYSALFETFRLYVFTGTPATVLRPCKLPGMGDHVFQPGDILHSMQEACAMDVEVFGDDVQYWKGHRFVGEGEGLLKFDLTFGIGRSPCPGRNFAIAELCMLAARLIQECDFSEPQITERLAFADDDFEVGAPVQSGRADIIDVDGSK
ncbi:Cytochrome-P450 [Teratosphaeria destructans]|uniref:Cytochrome-P450 n=1 Tax=Teratosphaeria destructans TaxID=418781 RepID=A0A9W7T015_9PEZI|nr:Cytochrome-P450 [Teratosphaeria destructans]